MIISGPELPVENLYGSTMVPSPTGKGIVVIEGMTNTLGYEGLREDDPPYNSLDTTDALLELSGDLLTVFNGQPWHKNLNILELTLWPFQFQMM